MKHVIGLAMLGLLVGCSDAGGESLGSSQQSLVVPNLTTQLGKLCMTAGRFQPSVSAGWVTTTSPQSRAVLGGTAFGPGPASRVEFKVDALSESIVDGPQREVCAELAAEHACKALYACWRGDGSWTIEQDNKTSCDPVQPATRTVLAQSTPSTLLPPLSIGGSVYEIHLFTFNQPEALAAFKRDGEILQMPAVPLGSASATGLAGYRANRVQGQFKLRGSKASGSLQSATSVQQVGTSVAGAAPLHCSYLAPPPSNARYVFDPNAAQYRESRTFYYTWDAPPGGASQYRVFRDLHEWPTGVGAPGYLFANYGVQLLGGHYRDRVGYNDANGNLSETAYLDTDLPAPPLPSLSDGQLSLGVVLFRYTDAPGPAEPITPADMTDELFSTSGASVRNYIRDVSRNQADLVGSVHPNWILLRKQVAPGIGDPATISSDCTLNVQGLPTQCQFGGGADALRAQALAAGFPVDSFDRVAFYVNGYADNSGSLSPDGKGRILGSFTPGTLEPNGRPNRSIIVHELGHTLGFGHSYNRTYPGPDLWTLTYPPGPNTIVSGGSSLSFDAQAAGQNTYRWHTLHQFELGWLNGQWTTNFAGSPSVLYLIDKIGSTNPTSLKHLRIELEHNVFYFVEYRTAEGFDAPNELIPGWQDPSGVAVWIHGQRSEGNFEVTRLIASKLHGGNYICDPTRKVWINVLGVGPNNATVSVERAPCQQ